MCTLICAKVKRDIQHATHYVTLIKTFFYLKNDFDCFSFTILCHFSTTMFCNFKLNYCSFQFFLFNIFHSTCKAISCLVNMERGIKPNLG